MNSPQLAAGIGILAFRQLSGIAAFHKIVTRFYFQKLNEIKEFHNHVNHQVLMQMEPEQRKTMLTNLDLLKASMEAVKEMMV